MSQLPAAAVDDRLQRFLDAEAALEAGEAAAFQRLARGLRDHALWPYLEYRLIRERLGQRPAAAVHAYLRTHADAPLAADLHRAWLHQLAALGAWEALLADHRPGLGVAADCLRRQALLATGRPDQALDDIEAVWLSGRSRPPACDPLFAAWRDRGGITPERIWRRFGLAMARGDVGLARYLRSLLPETAQAVAAAWISVHREPQRVLEEALIEPGAPHADEAVLHGLARWAPRDSPAAARGLAVLRQRHDLSGPALLELERDLALFLASRDHPEALERLTTLAPEVVDEHVRAWRVRTGGLRRGDWAETLQWLDRLTPAEAVSPRWRYWRARALEALGRPLPARRLYRHLAWRRDFYGFLAAERIGAPLAMEMRPLDVDAGEVEAVATRAGIGRARALLQLGRTAQARREWEAATATMSARELQAAALLAHRWRWHERAITTVARSGHLDDLEIRFPMPHAGAVVASAVSQAVDPAWVFAVARQESLFRADARSGAGALGLMQILPSTGRVLARDLELELPRLGALLDADTSIQLGSSYLRINLDRFAGNLAPATAAYNAGPGRVAGWLPRERAVAADVWVETIPYHETRRYVRHVLDHLVVYRWRLGARGGALRLGLQPVQPRHDG